MGLSHSYKWLIGGRRSLPARGRRGGLLLMAATHPFPPPAGRCIVGPEEGGQSMGPDPPNTPGAERAAPDIEQAALLAAVSERDGIFFVLDRELRHVVFNNAYAHDHLRHYGVEVAAGDPFAALMSADEQAVVLGAAGRALAGERVTESITVEADTRRTYETTWAPLRLPDGSVGGVVAQAREVTGLRAAEAERARLEESLRVLAENTEEVVFVLDRELRLVASNAAHRAALAATGSRPVALGEPIPVQDYDPETAAEWQGWYDRAFAGEAFRVDCSIPDVAGRRLYKTLSFRPIVAADGQVASIAVSSRDETAARERQAALAASEQRFRSLFETMEQGVVIQDAEGRIADANPAAERIVGLSLDQMRGLTSFDPRWRAVGADGTELPGEAHPLSIALREGHPVRGATIGTFNPSDEKVHWALVDAVPQFREGEERPCQAFAVFTDVTALKEAEAALREREEQFRTLFETMTQGVVFQAADGAITSANPAAERILGLTLDQLQGRTSSDPRWRAVREDGSDFPGEEHPAMLALRTGAPVKAVQMGIYHPATDETRWILIDAVPQTDPGAGRPQGVFTVFTDVTHLKEIDAEIARLQSFREIAEREAHIGYVTYDLATGRAAWSPAVYRLLDLPPDAEPGILEWLDSRVHPDDREALRGMPALMRSTGEVPTTTVRVVWADGSEHVLRRGGTVRRDASGTPVTVIGYVQDVTEQRRLEEQVLRDETERATELERQRIARELHDSVTQNIYSASLLLGALPRELEEDPEEAKADLERVRRTLRASLGELRTLLYELRPDTLTYTPLATLLERLGDVLAGFGETAVSTAADAALSLPDDVHVLFYQVAREALSNVGRHARAAHASAVVEGTAAGARLVVRDDGRGFDPAVPVAGMGLAIMRERAAAAGASLTVESAPGAGTTVTLVWRRAGRTQPDGPGA